jgi:CubicO group peptidase (beta-lactamase class C family)
MLRTTCLLLLPLGASLALRGADYFPPPDSAGGWRTLKDPVQIRATAGIDVKKLDETFDYIQQTTQHGGLLVVRHGHLIYERYFGRGHREALPELASCGKAFTSVAVGIMLREKAAQFPDGLDQKVFTAQYLPDTLPLDDPRKAQITLGQLLAMSAGIRGTNPVYVKGVKQTWETPTEDNGPYSTTDGFAAICPP